MGHHLVGNNESQVHYVCIFHSCQPDDGLLGINMMLIDIG
jgi:hypothetical protein